MTSIEGKRGEPRPRPPFPAVKGLFRQAHHPKQRGDLRQHLPQIILQGRGVVRLHRHARRSKGTKVFALGGKIHNTGLVEVPMGTTLRDDRGGDRRRHPRREEIQGRPDRRPLRRMHPRGAHLDIPIDYDNLIAIGSMMGSGGLIVMDEDTCMVDIAKFFLEFTVDEILRKMYPLPDRNQAYAGDSGQRSLKGRRHHGGSGQAGRAVPSSEEQLSVRPGTDGSQSRCCPPCGISERNIWRISRRSAVPAGVCKDLLHLQH